MLLNFKDKNNANKNYIIINRTKRRSYGGKVCTNSRGLNMPEDCVSCKSFTGISILYLFMRSNIIYKGI